MSNINRRKFFKKAISKCLPIIGAIVATALPIKADTIPTGCKDCASMCHNHCKYHCKYMCHNHCKAACKYVCRDACAASCINTCQGLCAVTCKAMCKSQAYK